MTTIISAIIITELKDESAVLCMDVRISVVVCLIDSVEIAVVGCSRIVT